MVPVLEDDGNFMVFPLVLWATCELPEPTQVMAL